MARREKWVKSAGPFFSEGIWKRHLRDPHSGSYLAAAITRVNCGCGSGDDQALAQFFYGKMVGLDVQDDSTLRVCVPAFQRRRDAVLVWV